MESGFYGIDLDPVRVWRCRWALPQDNIQLIFECRVPGKVSSSFGYVKGGYRGSVFESYFSSVSSSLPVLHTRQMVPHHQQHEDLMRRPKTSIVPDLAHCPQGRFHWVRVYRNESLQCLDAHRTSVELLVKEKVNVVLAFDLALRRSLFEECFLQM